MILDVSTDLMQQLLPLLRPERCTGSACLPGHHTEGIPSDAGAAVDTGSAIVMGE